MCLVFVRSGVILVHFVGRQREQSASFAQPDHHINLGYIRVELLHQVFAHQFGPALLVQLVLGDGGNDVMVDHVAMFQHIPRQFHEG